MRSFNRFGWLTSSIDGPEVAQSLIDELHLRAREDARARVALETLEDEHGAPLTPGSVSPDDVADALAALVPEGVVFELRRRSDTWGYGYFMTNDRRQLAALRVAELVAEYEGTESYALRDLADFTYGKLEHAELQGWSESALAQHVATCLVQQ